MINQTNTLNTPSDDPHSRRLVNPIRNGAIGFGVGFALNALFATLQSQIEFKGIFLYFTQSSVSYSLLYALSGGIGGMALGWSLPPRRKFSLALASALGAGLGEALTMYFSLMLGMRFPTDYGIYVSLAIRSAAMGVMMGALIGVAEKRWKYLIHFSILGVIGFTTYHLLFYGLSFYWLSFALPLSMDDYDLIIRSLIGIAANGIGGAIVGACLGFAFSKFGFYPILNSPQP